jgi:glycerate kinase
MGKTKRILICPDSFKDCLSSKEVGEAIAEGLLEVHQNFKLEQIVLSDGGDGVLDVFSDRSKYSKIEHVSKDALGREINCYLLWDSEKRSALISMAESVGLERLQEKERSVLKTSSYGFGVSIMEALRLAPMEIVLFLGGSATNDAGVGAAEALGYQFLDKKGNSLEQLTGEKLVEIDKILAPENKPWSGVKCTIANDVQNMFHGESGAVYSYGKQKGADEHGLALLEKGMLSFQNLVMENFKKDINFPGAGAAGGMAGGLSFFINGKSVSAFDWISKEVALEVKIKRADLIITGEGKLDKQSKHGKLVGQIVNLGQQYKKVVYIICGVAEELELIGFPNIFPLHNSKPRVIHSALEYTLIKEKAKTIAQSAL